MGTYTGFNDRDDRLEGSTDRDVISGLSGDDLLIGGAGQDTLFGGLGNDVLIAGGFTGGSASKAADDILDGGGGREDVAQLDYADLVFVGSEKPIAIQFTFITSSFQIQIDGFRGATISACESIRIDMAGGADFAIGGAGDDYIAGNGGNDTIRGGAGDDRITDARGVSSLDGGTGVDMLSLNWSDRITSMAFSLDTGVIRAGGAAGGRAINFEQLDVRTGSGNDVIEAGDLGDRLSVNGGRNSVSGLGGADTISAYDGADTLSGGGGNDRVTAGGGADRITGDDGADFIDGGDGADRIDGGAGNDTLYGVDGFLLANDTIFGGAGNDLVIIAKDGGLGSGRVTLDGGAGVDTVIAPMMAAAGVLDLSTNSSGSAAIPGAGRLSGFEIFNIRGSTGDDTIIGAIRNDTLDGSTGDDRVSGGAGADLISGGGGGDTLFGLSGNDTLQSYSRFGFGDDSGGKNVLDGGIGADTLYAQNGDDAFGGDGIDLLSYAAESGGGVSIDFALAERGTRGYRITGVEKAEGGNSADRFVATSVGMDMRAGAGEDTIIGRGGADTIESGVGSDNITLGRGKDTLVFFSLGDRATSDVVTDFDVRQDLIQLDGFSRIIPAGVMRADYLVEGEFDGAPQATAAHATWFYDRSDGELFLDWDGTGGSYQTLLMATFTNKPDLTAQDFFISLIG